ncbi:MAG TPA: hypothetical protein VD838_18960 [Anaeromyxobacteraceae bacterium]|nr:hypothetical protein [Anaeromyxobacteraceae bacterium]
MPPDEGAASGTLIRDSARRAWSVTAGRDARRGRYVLVRPESGDNEPFRASADGFRPDAYLPISGEEWSVLARVASGDDADGGREGERLRHEAFRLLDRMVVQAHHLQLMGAVDDDEDDDA